MEDSEEFIRGSPDIKRDREITRGLEIGHCPTVTHIIHIEKAEMTRMTETYASRDPPMPHHNGR